MVTQAIVIAISYYAAYAGYNNVSSPNSEPNKCQTARLFLLTAWMLTTTTIIK